MPIHDWAAAPSGLFHHFHQRWSVEICDSLNEGLLPDSHYALIEQRAVGLAPDVLTLAERGEVSAGGHDAGDLASQGGAVIASRPKTRIVAEADPDTYAARANRVVVRSVGDEVIAVIEIVSPGNKVSRHALRSFVEKASDLLRRGVHLLVVDLLPPTSRDPQGIHKAIWDEIQEEPFEPPPEKHLTLAAYTAGVPIRAYVEPVAVGEALPDMPVFLDPQRHVLLPLETTYQATWFHCPPRFRRLIDGRAR